MSAELLDVVKAFVRERFTKRDVIDVESYAGEFNAAEIGKLSFNCPAMLVSVLGWVPMPPGTRSRVGGRDARRVRMGAFIVTRHAQRDERMRLAMNLADRLCVALTRWVPQPSPHFEIVGLEDAPTAENLYSRKVDDKGLALWLVDWVQDIAPKPDVTDLFDLLRIDIEDTVHQGTSTPQPAPPPNTLIVTEDVKFVPLPPAT